MKPAIKLLLLFFFLWAILLIVWRPADNVLKFDFDAQNLNLWEYSARLGMLPFKDVFYPYGLLPYFQQVYPMLRVLYLALPALYLTCIYWIFNKMAGGGKVMKLAFILLCIFIIEVTGFETFTRYGGALVIGLLAVTSLEVGKRALGLGVLVGLLFTGLFDQGTYALILVGFSGIIKLWQDRRHWKKVLGWVIKFLIGVLCGILPFVLFLAQHSLWLDFLSFLFYLRDVSIFGKTPFTPFATSPDNLFTFAILFLSITWLSFKHIYKREPMFLMDKVMAITILFLIILEQKSFIRSMDRQLTFLGFTAYLLFSFSFSQRFSRIWRPIVLGALFLGSGMLALATSPVAVASYTKPYPYKQVLAEIRSDPNFNGKIYSFPGDPVFYIHTGQKPPFYFTAYEATPNYAQEKLIRYIGDNNIRFVLINTQLPALQDGVPNEVRNHLLTVYLRANFVFDKQIGAFAVWRKIR